MTNLTIIGNGKMATALIGGLCKSYKITVVGRDKEKLAKLIEKYPLIDTRIIENYDISEQNVILCVKPYALDSVASQIIGKARNLFSVLASVSISSLSVISAHNYYRVMPNISTKYKESITAIYSNQNEKIQEVHNLFKEVGLVVWASSEEELDLSTALCSSGVAFLALVAESLSDGAVKEGISREKSFEYIAGLFNSFASLLINNEEYSNIKNSVMSPSGTTAQGYYELEKNNTRYSFISALSASCEKAKSS